MKPSLVLRDPSELESGAFQFSPAKDPDRVGPLCSLQSSRNQVVRIVHEPIVHSFCSVSTISGINMQVASTSHNQLTSTNENAHHRTAQAPLRAFPLASHD
jgi:hypothetical protein